MDAPPHPRPRFRRPRRSTLPSEDACSVCSACVTFFISLVFWLVSRNPIGGPEWEAFTQLAHETLPTCASSQAASRAWDRRFWSAKDATSLHLWLNTHTDDVRFRLLPASWAPPCIMIYGLARRDGHKLLANVSYLTKGKDGTVGPGAGRLDGSEDLSGSGAGSSSVGGGSVGGSGAGSGGPVPGAGGGLGECVIYSVGGNMQVDFEEAMLAATDCHVWQFDCTVAEAGMEGVIRGMQHSSRMHFRPYCIGVDGQQLVINYEQRRTNSTLRSLRSVMSELGHGKIDLLKFDAEGAEHQAIPAFLAAALADGTPLPTQISLEVHMFSAGHDATMGGLEIFRSIYRAGYVMVSRETNPEGRKCCSEFTFVRGCGEAWMPESCFAESGPGPDGASIGPHAVSTSSRTGG